MSAHILRLNFIVFRGLFGGYPTLVVCMRNKVLSGTAHEAAQLHTKINPFQVQGPR